jgi:thiol-disulfide isomerase/thioredoxin
LLLPVLLFRLLVADPALPAGSPAPPVVVRGEGGGEVHLRLQGRPHLLLFFSSWCKGCPSYVSYVTRYADLERYHVALVPIDLQPSELPGEAEALWRRIGHRRPLYFDRYGEVTQAYRVLDLPTAVLVDGKGRVAGVLVGARRKADLQRLLRSAR